MGRTITWAAISSADEGDSARLGNVIDLWWFKWRFGGTQRGRGMYNASFIQFMRGYNATFIQGWNFTTERIDSVNKQCMTSKKCFGRHLLSTVYPEEVKTPISLTLVGNEYINTSTWWDNVPRWKEEELTRLQRVEVMMSGLYGVYIPYVVQQMLPEFRDDLSKKFYEYGAKYDQRMIHPPEADCVVHYRLGDAMCNENWWIISPKAVAKAIASLSPQPKVIKLLGSGLAFNLNDNAHAFPFNHPKRGKMVILGQWVLYNLTQEILSVLPDVEIRMPSEPASADHDWANLVTAKSIVVGSGSFGLTASAVRNYDWVVNNHTLQARSPAYRDGIYPCFGKAGLEFENSTALGTTSKMQMEQHNRWQLYDFECVNVQQMLQDSGCSRERRCDWLNVTKDGHVKTWWADFWNPESECVGS